MSRFQAGNGWQNSGAPSPSTPRQLPYDQVDTINLDSWGASEQSPPPADEVEAWVADAPAARFVDVRDLDAADDGEIVQDPNYPSAVYPEGRQMYANYQGNFESDMDEKLYKVAENIHNIQVAITNGDDFSFSGVQTAANAASDHIKSASTDANLQWVVASVPSILNDIEDNLVATNDYRQASKDLAELKTLVEDTYKFASDKDEDDDDDDKCTCDGKGTCAHCKANKKAEKKAQKKTKKNKKEGAVDNFMNRVATNGNQETLQVTDVRDLDDSGSNFTYEKTVTPDHVTNVLEPQEVNGEDAGYVPYYNDGAETGVVPQQDQDESPWPYDGSNPALVPYSAVQASRAKIFTALNLYDKLEKLAMVNPEEKFVHIAKFEQMSDAELKGFSESIDMFEKSGASLPRVQKVASTNRGRLPDMGRVTTASVSKDSVLADDYLIGIK